MSKIVIPGGAGVVGSTAVKTLVLHGEFDEIVLADIKEQKAKEIISEINSPRVKLVKFDAKDPASIREAVRGSDVVLNTVGPFFMFVKPIITAVLEEGIKRYVDVCDDVDVTLELLEMNESLNNPDFQALLGMGSSPGITNLLVKLAADMLLDEVDAADIYHVHGGEPEEGAGVIEHRFHAMEIDIPMYLDGELKYVKFFDKDGIALRERVDFYQVGENIPVYPYPHPEQVTIPRYVKLKRVTNKGMVLPEEYYNLIMGMVQLGLNSREPVNIRRIEVIPREFAISYIVKERPKILEKAGLTQPVGCVKVVVTGKKDGKFRQYIFQMASSSEGLGEGTGIPAAMAAVLMNRGKIKATGIFSPEGGVNPADFLGLLGEFMPILQKEKGGKSAFEGLLIEEVNEKGERRKVEGF